MEASFKTRLINILAIEDFFRVYIASSKQEGELGESSRQLCKPETQSKNKNNTTIGHFEKYHNTLCLSPQILHKHCFQFLLGLTMVPRENKNNAYPKFGRINKEYYGIFQSGLLKENAVFLLLD